MAFHCMKIGVFAAFLLPARTNAQGHGHRAQRGDIRHLTESASAASSNQLQVFRDSYRSVYEEMNMKGVEPAGDITGLPVFVWVMDAYSVFGSQVDSVWLEAMARRGFIAAAVDYVSLYDRLLWEVMFGGPEREFQDLDRKAKRIPDAISKLCERERADCSKGVAMAGHSQGGFIALFVPQYDDRITAVLSMGVGCLQGKLANALKNEAISKHLSPSARLYITGENDKKVDPNCLDQMTYSLQADGSGYTLIPEGPHQFYGTCDPVIPSTDIKCSYLKSQEPWGFRKVLDWLASTASPTKADITIPPEDYHCTLQPIRFTPECTGSAQPLIFVVLIAVFVVLLPAGACIYCWCCEKDAKTTGYEGMPESGSVAILEDDDEEEEESE